MSPRPIRNVHYDFSGQVVVITGGGRGQGRAHALGFAAAGADVAICEPGEAIVDTVPYGLGTDEDVERVAAEVRALGARCLPAVCDVRDSRQVAAFVDDVMEEFGRIDILVNNAGVESVFTVDEMPEDAWDVMMDTNVKGAFLMSKHVIPHLIAGAQGGAIITTGSTASLSGLPRQAHYCAAKHAVIGFSKAMAIDLAPHGITVNVVCPGSIDTPMNEGLLASKDGEWLKSLSDLTGPWNLLAEGMMEPEEITRAVMWLASDAASFVTGLALVVDAGFSIK